jgi:hypothetical protein
MTNPVRAAVAFTAAVLLAQFLVVVAANVLHEYWRITWSGLIFVCLGVFLGRCAPLADALVAVLFAAIVSATVGSAIVDALQSWWVPAHGFPLSGMTWWMVPALTVSGAWAVAVGSAVRPGWPSVRLPLAAYAIAGAIDWIMFVTLNAWFIGLVWPTALRVLAYGVMAFALGRAGTRSREAAIACSVTIAAGELTTIALLTILFGARLFRVAALASTVVLGLLAAGAVVACAYALGRDRSSPAAEAVR